MKNYTLDVKDEDTIGMYGSKGVEEGQYGDVVATYYLPNGTQDVGYICDYKWGITDANTLYQTKW